MTGKRSSLKRLRGKVADIRFSIRIWLVKRGLIEPKGGEDNWLVQCCRIYWRNRHRYGEFDTDYFDKMCALHDW